MGDFFEGTNFKDLVGSVLAWQTQREKAKVESRLAASREQQIAYDQAAKSTGERSQGESSKWLILGGFVALGLVVYVVAK